MRESRLNSALISIHTASLARPKMPRESLRLWPTPFGSYPPFSFWLFLGGSLLSLGVGGEGGKFLGGEGGGERGGGGGAAELRVLY